LGHLFQQIGLPIGPQRRALLNTDTWDCRKKEGKVDEAYGTLANPDKHNNKLAGITVTAHKLESDSGPSLADILQFTPFTSHHPPPHHCPPPTAWTISPLPPLPPLPPLAPRLSTYYVHYTHFPNVQLHDSGALLAIAWEGLRKIHFPPPFSLPIVRPSSKRQFQFSPSFPSLLLHLHLHLTLTAKYPSTYFVVRSIQKRKDSPNPFPYLQTSAPLRTTPTGKIKVGGSSLNRFLF
jgi:hypothetical protein